MFRRQKDIDAQNREMEALAERWELRIHAIAFTLTAVVLAMRLVAGRQDLTTDEYWEDTSSQQPAGQVLSPDAHEPQDEPGASEPGASDDERTPSADITAEPASGPYVGVP